MLVRLCHPVMSLCWLENLSEWYLRTSEFYKANGVFFTSDLSARSRSFHVNRPRQSDISLLPASQSGNLVVFTDYQFRMEFTWQISRFSADEDFWPQQLTTLESLRTDDYQLPNLQIHQPLISDSIPKTYEHSSIVYWDKVTSSHWWSLDPHVVGYQITKTT